MLTKEKKFWVKIGFLLITCAVLLPAITSVIDFLLTLARIDHASCKKIAAGFKFKGGSFGVVIMLAVSGVLCILPVGEWLEIWRGPRKKR